MIHTLEQQLTAFRVAYPSTRCDVFEDYIMYVFSLSSNAKRQADRANRLIESMGWDLVAIHAGRNSFFIVKSNETE